jgi:glycosyltransferase involved in cell wall biosynthesis
MSVSLIIPSYNSLPYLEEMASWLAPIAEEFREIIFVNDGGTDGSTELIRTKCPRFIVIEQENLGLAAARNTGAARASGEFLQFLDCDDKFEAAKVKEQVSIATQLNADVVYSD